MFVIKGLLIFVPIFIFRLEFFEVKNQKIAGAACIILVLTIAVSPFSFIGWIVDFFVFSVGAVIILRAFMSNWAQTRLIITRCLALLAFCGYLLANALFGPKLIDEYKKDGWTFRVHRISDMVLADTHRLRIDQTWGPFEKTVFEGQVQWSKCTTYDYNQMIDKLFTWNECN